MIFSKRNLLLLGALSLLISCGRRAENNSLSETTSLETVFVKGDPLNLIQGSQNNSVSFITVNNISSLDDYSLTNVTQYTEREEVVEKADTATAETGNEPVEADRTAVTKSSLFSFTKDGNEFVYASSKSQMGFSFTEKFGKLELNKLVMPEGDYPLKAIHYSLKKTQDAFSILTETSDSESGRILLAFTFTKKSEAKEIGTTSEMYKYLFGAGVKVPWEQAETLEVDICGLQSPAVERAYRNGMAQWNQALEGRLNIVTKTIYSYPPFSDLNTHCIYTVKDYQTLPGGRFVNMASTITKGNLFKGNLSMLI